MDFIYFRLNKEYGLKIGIKPHPHQISPESGKVVNMIKNQYSDLKWIDSKVPNNQIFNSGIKFGISTTGVIQLAYWNIVPIFAQKTCSSFDFTCKENQLKNIKTI